jgi:hypothetical protein
MKVPEDNKTIDMLGEPKRGRGRPRNPEGAKTGADRQKAYRERKEAAGVGFLTVSLPLDLLAALDEFIRFKDSNKDAVLEKLIRNQLLRKR